MAFRRENASVIWLILPALSIVFLSSLDLTVIAPVLPAMLDELSVNTAEADRYVWIVTGYLTAYIVAIPIAGRLSDVIGRRACVLGAILLFILGSAICAGTDSLMGLIAGRVIQGAGGGAILPVTLALAGDHAPSGRRAPIIGLIAVAETLGWVLGPIWGAGIISIADDWRWIFYLNIPIGAVALLYLVRSWKQLQVTLINPPRFDVLGALLIVIGVTTVNLALATSTEGHAVTDQPLPLGADANPLAPYRWPLLLAGAIAIALFMWQQRRAVDPLIPPALIRRRNLIGSNLANLGAGVGLMAIMVNIPVMVALLVSESRVSMVSAVLLSAFSLPMAIGSFAGGILTFRNGTRILGISGLMIASAALGSMILWPDEIAYAWMIPPLAIAGLGLGIIVAPLNTAAIDSAKEGELGIASGTVIISRLLGMTIGISLLSAWATNRIQQGLQNLPQVTPAEDESVGEFLERQEGVVLEFAIPLTLEILRDTFLVSALICLLAILPVVLIHQRNSRRDTTSD